MVNKFKFVPQKDITLFELAEVVAHVVNKEDVLCVPKEYFRHFEKIPTKKPSLFLSIWRGRKKG